MTQAIYTIILFMIMNGMVHTLTHKFHPYQLVFLQYLIAFIILLPFGFFQKRTKQTMTQWVNHIARAIFSFISTLLWFISLQALPLVNVITIGLTSVLFTFIGSSIFLKEKIFVQQWIAIILGLIGCIIIIKPELQIYHAASFTTILSALAFSIFTLLTRQASQNSDPFGMTVYPLGITLFLSTFFGINVWKVPLKAEYGLLCILGLLYAGAQYTFIKAYKLKEATSVTPLFLLRFPISIVIGYFFFNEPLTIYTGIGGLLIVSSVFYLTAHKNSKPSFKTDLN